MADFVTTIVTSSATAGIIVLVINRVLDALRRRRDARLSVLYVVNQLEMYASDCLDWLQDQQVSDFMLRLAEDEASLEDFPRVPAFDGFSPHVDWKAVGVEGTKEAFDFQVSVRSRRAGSALRWSPYLPDAIAKVKLYTARLGTEALELSSKLRRQWRLHEMKSAAPEGSGAMFNSLVDEFEEERRVIAWRTNPGAVEEPANAANPSGGDSSP